jgi:beta-1,4-N-acetylglucosaminyltransferase
MLSTPFTVLYSCLYVLVLSFRRFSNVRLLFTNGPGTAVPVALTVWARRMLGGTPSKLLFVESWCRVESFSLTGRLLRPFVDKRVVLWEALGKQDNRAEVRAMFE